VPGVTTPEPNGAQLWAALQRAEWRDLTLTLSQRNPAYWPGHMPFQWQLWDWATPKFLQKPGPYQTAWLTIDEHSGTHFDAPNHFIPAPDSGREHAGPAGLISGDQIAVDHLCGPAALIDVADIRAEGPGHSPMIEPARVREWEAAHGPLAAGDVVVFASGWDRFYEAGEPGYRYASERVVDGEGPAWPAPSVDCIDYLYDAGVRCVATDSPSMGPAQDGIPTHVAALSREMLFVEGLGSVHTLPPRGWFFLFLPIKVEGSTGSPGRAIGIVPADR